MRIIHLNAKRIALLCLFFAGSLCFNACREEPSPYGQYAQQEPPAPAYKEAIIVFFKDKGRRTPLLTEAVVALSDRAVERRRKQQISLGVTDLPVAKEYIDEVQKRTGGKLLNTSRWLNYAVIHLPEKGALLEEIAGLDYVSSIRSLGAHRTYEEPLIDPEQITVTTALASTTMLDDLEVSETSYGKTYRLLTQYQAEFLPEYNYFGKDKYIAILADGFGYINEKPEIAHLLADNQISFTYDFINGKSDVSRTSSTGNEMLGLLAAINPGQYIGLAPKANFALMRTDMSGAQEPFFETCWVAALECADSLGVDIVSSSCVYGIQYDDPRFDIASDEADGTSLSSSAADIAFTKGMLTVQVFHKRTSAISFIVPPSDARHVITVGNLTTNSTALWSALDKSTADGRMKPELAVLAEDIPVIYGWGNSYSSTNTPPIMAGLLASLWEAMPTKTAQEIKQLLETTASQAEGRDNLLGYGIPNFKKAYEQK